MNDNNVLNFNKKKGPDQIEPKPISRDFHIELMTGEQTVASGFLGLTPSFIVVSGEDGTIEYVTPMAGLKYAKSLPPETPLVAEDDLFVHVQTNGADNDAEGPFVA